MPCSASSISGRRTIRTASAMPIWSLSRRRPSMRRTARSALHHQPSRVPATWRIVSMVSHWLPTPPRPIISEMPIPRCSAVTGIMWTNSTRRLSSSWSSTMTHKDQVCLPTVPSTTSMAILRLPQVWLHLLITSMLRLKRADKTARCLPTRIRCTTPVSIPIAVIPVAVVATATSRLTNIQRVQSIFMPPALHQKPSIVQNTHRIRTAPIGSSTVWPTSCCSRLKP